MIKDIVSLRQTGSKIPMTSHTPIKELSLLVMQRRKELNIKQEDLSELTGISLRTVRDIERATANPSLGTMVQLMEALGIEITFRLRK